MYDGGADPPPPPEEDRLPAESLLRPSRPPALGAAGGTGPSRKNSSRLVDRELVKVRAAKDGSWDDGGSGGGCLSGSGGGDEERDDDGLS